MSFLMIFAMNCMGGSKYGGLIAVPEKPMFNPMTGKAKFQLNGCPVCVFPKDKSKGLAKGDKVNVNMPTLQLDNEKYVQMLPNIPDKLADMFNTSYTYMTKGESEDAVADNIAQKLQTGMVEALKDRGIDAVASESKNGNYISLELLNYERGSKFNRIFYIPAFRSMMFWFKGKHINTDLSVKANLVTPAGERDYSLYKHPPADANGIFAIIVNEEKKNIKKLTKRLAKAFRKKT